jgi:3'(2'), 5'-bisphosphate nucleotidase
VKELCVWIDPIDNTKGFINGTLDCVTILIGLSRNKRAFLGVVGLPYLKNNETISFQPEIIVGAVTSGKAFSTSAPHDWKQIEFPKPNNPLRLSISDSRGFNATVEELIKRNNATLVRVGGSGKKVI